MGRIYDQLGIEERVMTQMRLELGVIYGAIAPGWIARRRRSGVN